MSPKEEFNEFGAIQIKDVIPPQLSQFITHALMREYDLCRLEDRPHKDDQVTDAVSVLQRNLFLDTISERIWPFLENVLEEKLIPTYSYARLYTNGNELKNHIDRESCEISITIQLGRSHHYSWPIYTNNKRFDMAECDGVLYKGMEIPHWRNKCEGPDGYYSGQLFCHYVREDGPYAEWAGDKRWKNGLPFERFRTLSMDTK